MNKHNNDDDNSDDDNNTSKQDQAATLRDRAYAWRRAPGLDPPARPPMPLSTPREFPPAYALRDYDPLRACAGRAWICRAKPRKLHMHILHYDAKSMCLLVEHRCVNASSALRSGGGREGRGRRGRGPAGARGRLVRRRGQAHISD